MTGKRRHYHESSYFFEYPPPPQKKQTNKQTKQPRSQGSLLQIDKQTNKNLLTSYLKQATRCKKSRSRKLQTPSTGVRPLKIVSPPATRASMVSYYGILKMAVNSCLLDSTCMCDKLATSACGFYLQRAINFISKCGALSQVLNLAGQWKGGAIFLIFSLLTCVIANWKSAFFSLLFPYPLRIFISDRKFDFIDRFVSLNPVRKVAQVYGELKIFSTKNV